MEQTDPSSRAPKDLGARERLREAQRAERAALAATWSVEDHLHRASAKRDRTVAAAEAELGRVRSDLARAQGQLVRVSGLARAAQLLGVSTAALRRSIRDAEADK